MSSLATSLVSYEEFVQLPDPDNAPRYELHDGEVVLVPLAPPKHVAMRRNIVDALRAAEKFGLEAIEGYPYRPTQNYQFWYANVAVIAAAVLEDMSTWDDYRPYAPPLIVETLSPANTTVKVARQRIVSMSNGTREFWVVDIANRTVHVTGDTGAVHLYRGDESINVLGLMHIDVSAIFLSVK